MFGTEAIKVETSRETAVIKEPADDRSLRIESAFTMEVRSAANDDRLQADIGGTFELAYGIPDDESFSPGVQASVHDAPPQRLWNQRDAAAVWSVT